VSDSFSYQWVVVEDADIEALVTQVHMVNSSLADAGWGPQLLCSVFGLSKLGAGDAGHAVGVVEAGEAASHPTSATGGDVLPATLPPAAGDALPETTVGPGTVRPSTAYLVYLFKRGTFYPFVPVGPEKRDTEEELRLRSLVSDDLEVEPDLDRWFPLWDLPVG
jgi:hypothetical protein